MKYKELINFEPITSVIKLSQANDTNNQIKLIKTYVFSEKITESIKNIIIRNLHPIPNCETKGIQIVGGYGTGKSHLMSVVSAIAENDDLLNYIEDENIKEIFKPIAGKYKVLRFELGTNKSIQNYIYTYIEKFFNDNDIIFSFSDYEKYNEKDQLNEMMIVFQEKFPDKHFLIIIDELLEFLKGRPQNDLIRDFSFLRKIGEFCDNSRFKFICGIQEILYQSAEFQFAQEILLKIEDRFSDVLITKDDISFVVKNRLLKKDEHQKDKIRNHLIQYQSFFDSLNNNLNEFVELFPIHPKYIEYFSQIKHGKNQREILKVLSEKFNKIADQNIPDNSPGLITYDTYWEDLISNPSINSYPDIRKVKDIYEIIKDRINNHFTGARNIRLPLAKSIVNALCISVLCDDLNKNNGSTPEALLNDLCITSPLADSSTILLDIYKNTCEQLIKATSGQYVDKDPNNNNYFIRTEGGINVKEEINNYAETVIKRDKQRADQVFFDFLQYILELNTNPYRSGFKIWEDTLIWKDKNIFRLGYIFFGNANEKSTTIPIQQYYIYFLPLFSNIKRNDDPDEVYFDFSDFDEEFKETIYLYGAAKALEINSSSNYRSIYQQEVEKFRKKAIEQFKSIYPHKTKVIYNDITKTINQYTLLSENNTILKIFKSLSEDILNQHFNINFPDHPSFKDLRYPIEKNNFDQRIKDALKKIVYPDKPNSDGEAILKGLGLLNGNYIDIDNNKYCFELLKMLNNGSGKNVINRTDILDTRNSEYNLYYSKNYNLDYRLVFVYLAAMVFKGEIEIYYSSNKVINAAKINMLLTLNDEDYFTYQFIRKPQGIAINSIKTLFKVLGIPDRTSDLDKPEVLAEINLKAAKMLDEVMDAEKILIDEIKCKDIELLPFEKLKDYRSKLKELHELLDKINNITIGKLKIFNISQDELENKFSAYPLCKKIKDIKTNAAKFESLISYLSAAKTYIIDSQTDLINDINDAINNLASALQSDDENKIKEYETKINSLIDRYVDYYMGMAVKYYISKNEEQRKNELLNSDTKKICDILKDINIINIAQYNDWIESITRLKTMPLNFTRENIKQNPNIGFNPREYANGYNPSLSILSTNLENIFNNWSDTIITQLKDPTVKNNLDILDSDEKILVDDLLNKKAEIDLNNAHKIRDIINNLTQSFEKVEILADDVKQFMQKPLSPKEAVQLFTDFIDKKCSGKDRTKVKIIIK